MTLTSLTRLATHPAFRAAPLRTALGASRLASDLWLTRRTERIVTVGTSYGAFRLKTYPRDKGQGSRGIAVFGRAYEPLLMRLSDYVDAGDHAIDGGANTGIFSCALAALGAHVTAFEPLPVTAAHLEENIALNADLPGSIRVRNCALGEENGMAAMDLGKGAVAASTVHRHGGDRIDVPVAALDGEAFGGRVAFIKLDVEGAELAALRGARDFIARDRPVICLEVWTPAELQAIADELTPRGYRLAVLTYDGERPLPNPFRPIANLMALPDDGPSS